MAASASQQASNKIRAWTLDPLLFVKEVFDLDGTPGKRISEQQREGLEAYRRLLTAKLKLARGVPMTQEEKADAKKIGLCIHSGHGTGKTSTASWIILHFMVCRPFCKIPCIAPVGTQLKTNLWPEVHLWLRRSSFLQDLIKWQAEKIYWKEEAGREWFAIPRTVNVKASPEEQAETLAGIHADNLLVVVDESSGVPDPVFRPLEGSLTGPCNLVLQIGNPTQSHGFFYESFTKNRADWMVCHWNAEESELVDRTHIERMERKYGKDSNAYRIRVLGLPPTATPDTLIPLDWIMAAVNRPLIESVDVPTVCGIDVGRFGDDKSVIMTRQGNLIGKWDDKHEILLEQMTEVTKCDSHEVAGVALEHIQEHGCIAAAVDVIGIGSGVFDTLNRLNPCHILAVNVAESADEPDRFARKRDEIWWTLRDRFQRGTISIPHNDTLIGELSIIKYNFQRASKERIKIESKQELRDRGIASPNYADALGLSEYAANYVGRRLQRASTIHRKPLSAWVG